MDLDDERRICQACADQHKTRGKRGGNGIRKKVEAVSRADEGRRS